MSFKKRAVLALVGAILASAVLVFAAVGALSPQGISRCFVPGEFPVQVEKIGEGLFKKIG